MSALYAGDKMQYITNNTPIHTSAYSVFPYSVVLEGKLNKQTPFGDPYVIGKVIGEGKGKRILLPRNLAAISEDDKRTMGVPIKFKSSVMPRNATQGRILLESKRLLDEEESFIIQAGTGMGKSLGRDNPVIMYDGSLKMSQDIEEGDLVMGVDSTPRTVTNVNIQSGDMYRITPIKGESFTCNGDHILNLKRTRYYQKNGSGGGGNWKGGDTINITVNDYLTKSKKFKHLWKLWRTELEFEEKKTKVNPYAVGLWLSDGCKESNRLSCGTKKKEALDYISSIHKVNNNVWDTLNNCWRYTLDKPFYIDLVTSNGERYIPKDYLINSTKNRLELLAGILDGDGHLTSNCFEIICKDKCYAEQVAFLSRSLGLAVTLSDKIGTIKSTGFKGNYTRILIYGDTDMIPNKITYKQAGPRKQKKNVLMTGFKIEPIGIDNYYGMALDGDHLYLLGDFTVTHNTVMAMDLIAHVGRKALIIVTKEDLRDQWYKAARTFLGLKKKHIGIIQGDRCDVQGKKVVIAMMHSMSKIGKYNKSLWGDFGIQITDECFHPSHELLTDAGWIGVSDITSSHRIAQVNSTTQEITFSYPIKVISKMFDGDLVNLRNKKCDLLATPNHQHLVYYKGDTVGKKIAYKDFKPSSRYHHLYSGKVSGTHVLSDLERLNIAYQADGTIIYKSKGVSTVRFMFRKFRKIYRLKLLLESVGMPYVESINGRGDTSITYKVNEEPVKDLNFITLDKSTGYYLDALDEIVLWDGWENKEGTKFFSSVIKSVSDRVQAIVSLSGKISNHIIVSNDNKPNSKPEYRISWYGSSKRGTNGLISTTEYYSGLVYCVRMPEGTVVTRRNNKVTVTGNCHRIGTDHFSNCMWLVPAKIRLGLSATPKRKDGKDDIIHGHIGPIKVVAEGLPLTPKVLMVRSGFVLPMVKRPNAKGHWNMVKLPHVAGKTQHINKLLANDKVRNDYIADFVKKAYDKDRKIIIFSEIKIHLANINEALIRKGVKSRDIAMYVGGLSANQRNVAEKKRVLLSTYMYVSEGTDIPDLDTAVFGTPRSDVVQITGRILREHPDKKEPLVLDMVDLDSNVFVGYAKKRRAWYSKINAEIKTVGMNLL